jgi:hypothetical protein
VSCARHPRIAPHRQQRIRLVEARAPRAVTVLSSRPGIRMEKKSVRPGQLSVNARPRVRPQSNDTEPAVPLHHHVIEARRQKFLCSAATNQDRTATSHIYDVVIAGCSANGRLTRGGVGGVHRTFSGLRAAALRTRCAQRADSHDSCLGRVNLPHCAPISSCGERISAAHRL